MKRQPFIERVRLRNYKSIASCDVRLGCFTALVGRNGSGKSNFLDAPRFVSDGLVTSLEHAVRARGGANEIRHRSAADGENIEIRLGLILTSYRADYGFGLSEPEPGRVVVAWERLRITSSAGEVVAEYSVDQGRVVSPQNATMPPASTDRLYLVAAAGLPMFRDVYDALTGVKIYRVDPNALRQFQTPQDGGGLLSDGSNLASVISKIKRDAPDVAKRVREYLSAIAPDVDGFDCVKFGEREVLAFRQAVPSASSSESTRFYAHSMSDGTLRAFATLVAAMQPSSGQNPIRFAGVEEPETALHPAAAEVLVAALREASEHRQIVITTHSPDLIDHFNESEELLIVQSKNGLTEIAPASEVSRKAISDQLYSPGELLRMDQLLPDVNDIERQKSARFGFESFGAPA